MNDPSFDAAIDFAADLIRIPSPPGAEEEVALRVVQEMERLGFDEAWTDDVGNAIGRIRGRGEAPPVMLSSHLDVVDPGEVDAWEFPPYDGVVDGGFLHGRGAMDIKGPLAIQTYAAARFIGQRPPGDLIVAHTVLEERGGWGMDHLVRSGDLRPGAVIIGESTDGDICIGHRGRAELLVTVHGLAGHASAPERARNALDGVGPVCAAIRAFSAERLTEEHALLGRANATPTDVLATPRSRNVIPDTATVVVDWRVLPGPGADAAAGLLRDHLAATLRLPEGLDWSVRFSTEVQRTWTGREQERRLFSPGFVMAPDHPVVEAAADAVATATGRAPAVRAWRFATDGGHTCGEQGIPTIGYAPGEERHAHTNTERLALDSAREAFEAHPRLIESVFRALGNGA